MKTIYYAATSIDGFIADAEHGVGWLDRVAKGKYLLLDCAILRVQVRSLVVELGDSLLRLGGGFIHLQNETYRGVKVSGSGGTDRHSSGQEHYCGNQKVSGAPKREGFKRSSTHA